MSISILRFFRPKYWTDEIIDKHRERTFEKSNKKNKKRIKKDLTNCMDDSSTTRLKAEKPSDSQANK